MEESKSYTLPSGAELIIRVAQFAVAWDLYQQIVRVTKDDGFSAADIVANTDVEKAVRRCMSVCQYNKLKVTDDTFEPVVARQDYVEALFIVAKENIAPFSKALISK
jgi:hypothetical protein